MNGWTDYMVKQEQYRDQLREAENHRQIKRLLADQERSAIWQPIGSLVLGITKGSRSRSMYRAGSALAL